MNRGPTPGHEAAAMTRTDGTRGAARRDLEGRTHAIGRDLFAKIGRGPPRGIAPGGTIA